ncbi:MAG: MFS transporter, partial [Actinobacteria bacterium]|nr:MFS transporter [Actinomycetota bacterium]
ATSSLLRRIVDDVPLSVTEAGLLGSLPPFCFAASGLLVPWLLRRLSAERIAVLLLVVAAGAQVVRPWAPGAWAFLAASVVVLVAMGGGNVVLPPIVKAWFPDRIPQVTGAYLVAVTAGVAVPPLLSVPVADAVARGTGSDATGWRVSLALWGVVAALVAVAWLVPAAHPRVPARGRRPAGADADDADDAPAPPAQPYHHLPVWRSRVAWGVALLFGFQSFASYIGFTWLPTRLTDAGVGDQRAAVMLAVFGAMGLPASIVVPRLVARVRNTFALVTAFAACFAAGYVGIALAPTSFTLLWVLVAGWGSGLFPLALTLVNLRTRTPATAASLSAFAQGLGYLVAAAGPFSAGAVADATGRWDLPFLLGAASMGFVVLGAWLAGSRTLEDDLERVHALPATG